MSGATAVDFGSNPGTAVSVINRHHASPSSSPAGTGTVNVTVTTPNGTSATSASDQYTYNAPPTVTGVSPNNGPQGGANTVTVTGTGFVSGPTAVDFGSTAGTAVSVNSSGTRSPSSSRRGPARSR